MASLIAMKLWVKPVRSEVKIMAEPTRRRYSKHDGFATLISEGSIVFGGVDEGIASTS